MKFVSFGCLWIFLGIVLCSICSCGQSFTDDRDGRSYTVVQIGEQLWMAENLNYAMANRDESSSSFCPEGDSRKCKEYGRLYTWEAAQSACPAGWRLPNRDDFNGLVAAAGVSQSCGSNAASVAGKVLKSTSGWFKKGNGSDDLGFAALPAGYMSAAESSISQPAVGKFDGIGGYAYFWSATADGDEPAFAYYLFLDFSSAAAEIKSFDKNSARSVRCVKN